MLVSDEIGEAGSIVATATVAVLKKRRGREEELATAREGGR
jgi:hypothetical protein